MIVVLPHVAQTAAVRALLSDVHNVLVGTANSVQGMERPAAVIAHPLAGYGDPTTFGTDADPTDPGIATHRNLWERL
ncbi:MAG: hypothetical protein IPM00_02580 [Tetrasphaera sp.]|nr:hypothetical protein [Tetrasphaera sp.]